MHKWASRPLILCDLMEDLRFEEEQQDENNHQEKDEIGPEIFDFHGLFPQISLSR